MYMFIKGPPSMVLVYCSHPSATLFVCLLSCLPALYIAADGLIPGTGHFHVFVDVAEQTEEGEAIPFDYAHKHFGKGQTAADIELAPVSTVTFILRGIGNFRKPSRWMGM
jgi:hypothetical protein